MKKFFYFVVLVAIFCASTQIANAQTECYDFMGFYKTLAIDKEKGKVISVTIISLADAGFVRSIAVLFGGDKACVENFAAGDFNSDTHFTAIKDGKMVHVVAVRSKDGVFSFFSNKALSVFEIDVNNGKHSFITKKALDRWGYNDETTRKIVAQTYQ